MSCPNPPTHTAPHIPIPSPPPHPPHPPHLSRKTRDSGFAKPGNPDSRVLKYAHNDVNREPPTRDSGVPEPGNPDFRASPDDTQNNGLEQKSKSQIFSSQRAPAGTTPGTKDLNKSESLISSSQKAPAGTTPGTKGLTKSENQIPSSQKAPAGTSLGAQDSKKPSK